MKRSARWALALLCLFSAAAVAQPAPAESRQFDFLLGQWDLEVHPKVSGIAAAIHGVPRLTGTLKARRTLDGLAIEDEMRIVDASGNPISFTHALRTYSKGEGRWKVGGLDVFRSRFSESSGTLQGGEMRLSGRGFDAEGHPTLTRVRYFDIGPDAFRIQQDRSSDDGRTWDEGVVSIAARRVAAAPK